MQLNLPPINMPSRPQDHAESAAQRLLETILVGSRLVYRPKQSRGEYDFDLIYPDGTVAAVEVTSSVDQETRHTYARIHKSDQAVKTILCRRDWWIHAEPGADIRKIRREADKYLAKIESVGIERFFAECPVHPSIREISHDLRVCGGAVCAWKNPGYILIDLMGGGGIIDARNVLEAAMREADKADNRNKLAKASTAERHLVVYIDSASNYLPWCSLVDCEPPCESLQLQPEITDLWVFTQTRSINEYVVWRARITAPWVRIGPLTLKPK